MICYISQAEHGEIANGNKLGAKIKWEKWLVMFIFDKISTAII